MAHHPIQRRRWPLLLVACLPLCTAPACSDGGSPGGEAAPPATKTTAEEPATTTSTTTTGASGPQRSILGGWLSYELAEGWSVVREAEGLVAIRDDIGDPPIVTPLDEMEVLLELAGPSGDTGVTVVRDPAFLDAPAQDEWTDRLAEELANDVVELVADEELALPHGPARQLVFEGLAGTFTLTTTSYGEQRLAVVGRFDPDLGAAELAAARAVAESVELAPDLVLAPLLQFHAGLVSFATEGETVAEVDLAVPSGWVELDDANGAEYVSPDVCATALVRFDPLDDLPPREALDEVIVEVEAGDEVLGRDQRTIGDVRFHVARVGGPDLAEADLGTSWLLVGDTPDRRVHIRLEDECDRPNAALLREVLASIDVRTR